MKQKKYLEDILSFAVVLGICLFFLLGGIEANVPEAPAARNMTFTPRTFPTICFSVIGLCSAAGLIKSAAAYVKSKKEDGEKKEGGWKSKSRRERIAAFMPWISLALCYAYAWLFSHFGFIAATVVIPPLLLWLLGNRKWQHYVYVYAFCACMYVIFKFVLSVNLP